MTILVAQNSFRETLRFLGARTTTWGTVTLLSGLAAFGFDLAFAMALQRFLVSTGLLGPVTASVREAIWLDAILVISAGIARVALMWVNGVATGATSIIFESEKKRDISAWSLHSGQAAIGQVTTLFNDVAIGASAVVSNMFYIASRLVLVAGTLMALGFYSISLTATVILIVVVAVPVQRLIDRRINRSSSILQRSLAEAVDRLTSGVKNAVFLKIHGLASDEYGKISKLVQSYQSNTMRYFALSAARGQIPQFFSLVVVIGVALLGGYYFGNNPSVIASYLYLTIRLFQALSDTARVTANTRVNSVRYNLLRTWWTSDFVPASPRIGVDFSGREEAASAAAFIGWRACNVSFGWDDSAPILRDVSVTIEPKTATVVVGPSGVGKTTFLLMLASALTPTKGEIQVMLPDGDFPVGDVRVRLGQSIAYVGPDPFVVPGTIRDFLLFGLRETPDEEHVLHALQLAQCEFVLQLGLHHRLTEQGDGLSAGQKQRLSIARALLRRPSALLLDEPTANLDLEAEALVVETLAKLKGTLTIVVVTHRMALKQIADQVLELSASEQSGRLVSS